MRSKIESFLKSPKGAIEKDVDAAGNVIQVKNRNIKMRAFAVWCEAPPFDVFIIQAVYRKKNQADYWKDDAVTSFVSEAKQYRELFDDFSDTEAQEWLESARHQDDLELVGP